MSEFIETIGNLIFWVLVYVLAWEIITGLGKVCKEVIAEFGAERERQKIMKLYGVPKKEKFQVYRDNLLFSELTTWRRGDEIYREHLNYVAPDGEPSEDSYAEYLENAGIGVILDGQRCYLQEGNYIIEGGRYAGTLQFIPKKTEGTTSFIVRKVE